MRVQAKQAVSQPVPQSPPASQVMPSSTQAPALKRKTQQASDSVAAENPKKSRIERFTIPD